MTDFFNDLEHELRRAHRRDTESHARSRVFDRRRPPGLPAAGLRTLVALAVVVALVAVVLAVARESDVERSAAPPGEKVVATDVEAGVRFSLDGRVLTVQLLPDRPAASYETVNGAQISATCGANVADPRRETTLTRPWPAGQTSLSYRFPRDVSRWCRLYDRSGTLVASVEFPGAWPGERGPIAETANKWARHFASSPQTCTDYMSRTACEQVTCQREGGTPIPDCRAATPEWGAYFRGATVQAIAISGDRAAATFSNDEIVQLRRIATGEWLIDRLGPVGAVGSDK